MVLIAPSMLSADFLHLEKDVELVNKHADIFHLDIMDGTFVPNISYGFPVVEAIAKKAEKLLDVHLMIVNPQNYVERFAKAGAGMISFHLEAARLSGIDAKSTLLKIKDLNVKAGLVINPDIDVKELFPYLEFCDFVLIMSVFAGFGGQKFIESTFERVVSVKEEIMRRGLNCLIEVDGGVSPENSSALVKVGADILVAGSSVFKSVSPADAIVSMKA